MACDKFPCQSLYWGSKNQVQKNSKKIKTNTSSCTKGFGGHREQSVKQRPECKLSGECNQRRGSGGGGNWCRKRKELRTVSGGGHASSLRLVLSKETTESLSERCLSNNQKGEVGGQQPSTASQTPGQRFSPWTSAVTHEWALSTLPCGPTHSITQRPEGRKWGHTEWIWGRSWSAAPVGKLAPRRTGHSRNKGQVRPKPWKWVTSCDIHTHWWEGTILLSPFCNFISIFLGFPSIYVST